LINNESFAPGPLSTLRVLYQEREQKAEEERIRMENILSGNPLLNLAGQQQQQQQQIVPTPTAFSVKRR
jgi:protein CWC15